MRPRSSSGAAISDKTTLRRPHAAEFHGISVQQTAVAAPIYRPIEVWRSPVGAGVLVVDVGGAKLCKSLLSGRKVPKIYCKAASSAGFVLAPVQTIAIRCPA